MAVAKTPTCSISLGEERHENSGVENEPKTGIDLKQGLDEAEFVVDLGVNDRDGLHLELMADDF
jgi:hypothetical protein